MAELSMTNTEVIQTFQVMIKRIPASQDGFNSLDSYYGLP